MKDPLIIGSRGSKLALWQAEWAKARLTEIDPKLVIRVEIIRTTGDVKTEPLSVIGGQGVFTKELEDALFERRIDIAVHSLKDLPTVIPAGLTLAAICEREDPSDALVSSNPHDKASIRSLPGGSVVGTSSQRRLAQLKNVNAGVVFKELRGNVDTRLRKLDEGQYDALVLATAGLLRLGLAHRITARISTDEMLPAVGQGALAIEARAEDSSACEVVAKLNHAETHVACVAERAFLQALGGGCQLPIAGFAQVSQNKIVLEGLVASRDGSKIVRDKVEGPVGNQEVLGRSLAKRLFSSGASTLLKEWTSRQSTPSL